MASTKESIKCKCQSSLRCVSVGVGPDESNYIGTGNEMEKPWEPKDHPLLNDLVLSNLFEFLGAKDLKACRLVCQKWYELTLTLPSTRSKFSVKLNGNDVEITKRLSDFVEVFKQNKLRIPFTTYYLGPFCTRGEHGQEFLQLCGSTAKKVFLKPDESSMSTLKVEDISELVKAMPNIEEFDISDAIHSRSGSAVKLFSDDSSTKPTLSFLKKIVVNHTDPNYKMEYCPTFMEEIISIAPNISDFSVEDLRRYPEQSRIEEVLNGIEKFERESVVRNLHLTNTRTQDFESLRRSAENGLKLQSLIFILRDTDKFELPEFPNMAELFKNSIERLHVDLFCSSLIQLPCMPKLERLAFNFSNDFDSKSVDLNKLFPALKELELHFFDSEDGDQKEWEEFLPNSEPCPNVKTLFLGLFVRLELFDHILNIFPKLTKLELNVKPDGVEILRKIMTHMTQLEELSVDGIIEGIESIDALLTGIPVQKIKELEHVVIELKEMAVQLRAENIRHYRTRYFHFPSITNLTNLKRLHLNTIGKDDDDECSQMSDVFVYFGLYPMKHIKEVVIENCEFTKTGCEILTAEMGLVSWSFKDKNEDDVILEVK